MVSAQVPGVAFVRAALLAVIFEGRIGHHWQIW